MTTKEQIEECYRKLTYFLDPYGNKLPKDDQEQIHRILVESFVSPSERFLKACREGDFETCKKFDSAETPFSDGFVCACQHGHLQIAQWIQEMHSVCIWRDIYTESMYLACVNGHLPVVEWLLNNLNATLPLMKKYPYVFDTTCMVGHLEVAQLLYKIYTIADDDIKKAFLASCEKGKTSVVMWLYNYVSRGVRLNGYLSAIRECRLELAKAMYNETPFEFTASEIKSTLTTLFSKEDWQPMATWLIEKYPDEHPGIAWAFMKFIDSCKGGELERAKWIVKHLQTKDNPIDIEDGFFVAVRGNHLEVTKWLLTFGISSNTIIEACQKNDNEVVEWLKELITFSRGTKERFVITLQT